ncbi:unnamed protein product [Mycena citricolor]|uniref:Uncharacterized protein n=1 Tax=Mycena citricolor TaxID=2018698 RepID=A0AAD2HPS4_9AGAR|nr:unnamed protein product [Mycena citricolor]
MEHSVPMCSVQSAFSNGGPSPSSRTHSNARDLCGKGHCTHSKSQICDSLALLSLTTTTTHPPASSMDEDCGASDRGSSGIIPGLVSNAAPRDELMDSDNALCALQAPSSAGSSASPSSCLRTGKLSSSKPAPRRYKPQPKSKPTLKPTRPSAAASSPAARVGLHASHPPPSSTARVFFPGLPTPTPPRLVCTEPAAPVMEPEPEPERATSLDPAPSTSPRSTMAVAGPVVAGPREDAAVGQSASTVPAAAPAPAPDADAELGASPIVAADPPPATAAGSAPAPERERERERERDPPTAKAAARTSAVRVLKGKVVLDSDDDERGDARAARVCAVPGPSRGRKRKRRAVDAALGADSDSGVDLDLDLDLLDPSVADRCTTKSRLVRARPNEPEKPEAATLARRDQDADADEARAASAATLPLPPPPLNVDEQYTPDGRRMVLVEGVMCQGWFYSNPDEPLPGKRTWSQLRKVRRWVYDE